MTYTMLAALSIPVAVILDRWVLRTRLTGTGSWWLAYTIIVAFQLVTNGWLTGRGIVRYDAGAIVGNSHLTMFGAGRVLYAPLEDLGFGFALVLITCAVWVRLGRTGRHLPSDLTCIDHGSSAQDRREQTARHHGAESSREPDDAQQPEASADMGWAGEHHGLRVSARILRRHGPAWCRWSGLASAPRGDKRWRTRS